MILADQNSAVASIWQLVESCEYRADLTTWTELARGAESILDLGCGIGRVARHLAADGHAVLGLDRDPAMVADLNRHATERDVAAITGDVTDLGDLDLGRAGFDRIFAPQQLLQILGGEIARGALLAGVKRRLGLSGQAAFAISEELPRKSQAIEVLPDVRELDDWVYSSRPVAIEADEGSATIIRLRQVVAPDGSLEETYDRITLDRMDRTSLARELKAHGLAVLDEIEIPPTDLHIASLVIVAAHDTP